MKRGQQKRISTPGQQQWHHLFGAYNFLTDEVIALPATAKNSDAFIAFLDFVVQQLPSDKPVILIMDNASYHHSAATHAAFAILDERILPQFLPPIARISILLSASGAISKTTQLPTLCSLLCKT